jgi:hypothetical protein
MRREGEEKKMRKSKRRASILCVREKSPMGIRIVENNSIFFFFFFNEAVCNGGGLTNTQRI